MGFSCREVLNCSDHRPYPLPAGPWVMRQSWHDLLFAHWPVPANLLRPLIPETLEIDTFDGDAWIGVVPFRMSGVVPRATFPIPGLSAFLELNVRTYVRHGGKSGVYFFSLDAASPPAVYIARTWFKLPYFCAAMSQIRKGEQFRYQSVRTHRGASPARLLIQYGPVGPPVRAERDSLAAWFTERYALFTTNRRGRVFCGDIHHIPWPVQPAQATIEENTMAAAAGITLPDIPPILHFAADLHVLIWPLRRCS